MTPKVDPREVIASETHDGRLRRRESADPLLDELRGCLVRVADGERWHPALVGPAQAPLRWQLLQGPIGAQVIVDAKGPRLYWLPDVLRLGLRRPGQPRKPGTPLALQVSLTDATGTTASAAGELLVVPTPLP